MWKEIALADIHRHLLNIAEHLWGPNSGCEHSETMGGAFQQWQQWCERQATFQVALHSCQLSWISWKLDKPSTLTTTLQRWLSWRPKFSESGQRRRQPFSGNTILPGPIPVWRPWSTLQSLTGLSYHTHHIVQIWLRLPSVQTDESWTMQAPFSWLWCHHRSFEKVGCLRWCRFLLAQHVGSCSSLAKMHSQVVVTVWNDSVL
jgi:hypothetical protein